MILASTALLWSAMLLAPAQDLQASAELFVRPAPSPAASGEVRAAIRVSIAPGWHLYHFDLGQPDAVGKPTKLSFTSGGEWSEVRFPAPRRIEQPGLGEGGRDTWIWAHEGGIVLYAAGRIPPDAQPAQVALTITGLTCEDQGSCIPYKEQLTSLGAGTDALFADFPSDLHAPQSAGAGDAPKSASEGSKPVRQQEAPSNSFGSYAGKGDDSDAKADAALYVRREGAAIRAAIEIKIRPGWHLYHDTLGPPDAVGQPTRVQLSGAGIEWGPVVFPEPVRIEQPDVGEGGRDTWILGHEGRIVLSATGHAANGSVDLAAVRAAISGLTCIDDGSCVPYREEIASSGAGSDELFAAASALQPGKSSSTDSAKDPSPTRADPADSHPARRSLAGFLMLAVFWGLFTLLMPCTYPMIPITISFFTKQATARDGNTLSLSLLYGLGIVAVFILIGVAFGSVIIPFATHPITNLVIGAFFVFFSLVLFGAVDLQPPRMLMDVAGKASMTGGYLGVFLMGVTLVVTSFTCTAPFVGSLLAVGASDGNLLRIVLGMGVFGLTMAVPFVLLSMLPKKIQALPRSGEWMHVLKVFLGFVELAAALKFLSNTDLVWGWGVLSRELFLLLWMGIFLVAGLFLFGMIRLKGEKATEIGALRMVGATLVFLFALYCGYGMLGHSLDTIMTAIVPNYSSSLTAGPSPGEALARATGHEIIKDDYDGALTRAREQGKLLLVNFTGFT
jgi:thiol:disulfide interchange protein